ncbi:MaoC/PaaZ C-terminal domain-containing protein [Gryllotalpicola koreensis]|uniref:MaoC/PaaZ C-terminal domain-containing protein n=1 Tax=Gryllotalpicola koreensis TaxID=993086 RepID=A0ABP7ZYC5_9MICO
MAFTTESVASIVGQKGEPVESSWTSKDALLYALAVGASQDAPFDELEFTTENGPKPQLVVPSFICVAAKGGKIPGLEIDLRKLLHGGQSFELFGELKPDGRVRTVGTVDSIYDKGSAAVVNTSSEIYDADTGELLAKTGGAMFLRGEGGWGGERGEDEPWAQPEREPDETVVYTTRTDQALLYRLTGDRNPLHSNPEFAKLAGFERPILHGMCTYGFTVRALLHAVAGGDPNRFGRFSARFSKTVTPGDTLTVSIWKTEGGALFQTAKQTGDVVIDRGVLTLR